MKLFELEGQERLVFLSSLLLVIIVFASSLYTYVNPPVQVMEGKVFDSFQSGDKTIIWTYGEGKLALHGHYDLEIGATYRITYKGIQRDFADTIISIEKIS